MRLIELLLMLLRWFRSRLGGMIHAVRWTRPCWSRIGQRPRRRRAAVLSFGWVTVGPGLERIAGPPGLVPTAGFLIHRYGGLRQPWLLRVRLLLQGRTGVPCVATIPSNRAHTAGG